MSKARQNHYFKFFVSGQYMSVAGAKVVPAIKPTCKGERYIYTIIGFLLK
jgi:hypothetical protein